VSHDVLAHRRAIKSVITAYTQPVLTTTNRSKSHNHAIVRSTTHRRGATPKSGLPGFEIPLVNLRSQPNSCFIHKLNGSPLAPLQGLPKDFKPVARWDDRDEAWTNVVQGIKQAIKDLRR
jgi:hypothetical protein